MLGAIPALLAGLAGLALPTLRRAFGRVPASALTGPLAAVIYLLTSGAHLLSQPRPVASVLMHTGPAFVGVALAAWLATRMATPRATPRATRNAARPDPRGAHP